MARRTVSSPAPAATPPPADTLGLARVRAARHRVEHAEMLTPETIAAFAE
ncbi:hypothetical protein HRW13_20555, partial [Streptomyces lunaelactis]|nr:hypothetical protein [Streptomyces lunaelactis]